MFASSQQFLVQFTVLCGFFLEQWYLTDVDFQMSHSTPHMTSVVCKIICLLEIFIIFDNLGFNQSEMIPYMNNKSSQCSRYDAEMQEIPCDHGWIYDT